MTDIEIVEKAKAFMDKEVVDARKMRDWEWCKTPEDYRKYKKTAQAWVCSVCMFTQTLVKGYGDELVAYANKCRDEIEEL